MPLTSHHFRFNDRLIGASKNAPVMKRGEAGHAVRLVQKALIDLGYPMPVSVAKYGSPDGIYGGETKEKVRKLQIDTKLPGKDGIVGTQTITQIDKMLVARHIPFTPLPKLPPGTPGGVTDIDANARRIILNTLATNPIRSIPWSLEWFQMGTGTKERIHILGDHYSQIGQAIYDDRISVEVRSGIKAAALYLPKTHTFGGTGTPIAGNTFIISRPLRNTLNDRSMIIHEVTHAICDGLGRPLNALFSEVVAFVAEGLYCRKAKGGPKMKIPLYELADEIAEALLKGQTPKTTLIDDLSLQIKADPTYGDFTYGTVQYNGIPR